MHQDRSLHRMAIRLSTACLMGPLAVLLLALPPAVALAAAPLQQRGIALGLFSEDPEFDYEPLLREIRRTGATHVSLVVPYYQHSIGSTRIGPHPRFSPADRVVERTILQAHRAGLQVLLFPILRLEYAVTVVEWRGTLEPRDPAAWWRSYRDVLLKFARLAARLRVAVLCVGSELSTLDTRAAPWEPLLREVRRLYRGQLLYSANWDHYTQVGIWHLVDLAGLSAYFGLTEGLRQPSLARLIHGWREHRVAISRWRAPIGKPLVFSELGYHSQDRTNAFPWDESADKPVNLREQADCYEAFVRVFGDASYLQGVYFWNWFGWGGPRSREYCPRGKPAARVVCRWYGGERGCPAEHGMPWFDRRR